MRIIAGYMMMSYLENPAENKRKAFALVLTNHRIWGLLFQPFIIENEANNKYFSLAECLSPYQSEETIRNLSQSEIELVRIVNEYSERNLFKLFSRDKSVKDFTSTVDQEKIEKFIRPYIETRLFKSFIIARDEEIPVFLQRTKLSTLHRKDQLILSSEDARPVFRFDRNETGTTYRLKIEAGDSSIELLNNAVDILAVSPCLIRCNDMLLHITEIDGQKLKPFLSRESVLIPKKSEIKYFETFVMNAVNSYKVEGTGFQVLQPPAEKHAHLSIESNLRGSPVMILKYNYSGNTVMPDEKIHSLTVFENAKGEFAFKKYTRDFAWEKQCRDTLEEFGFYSDNDVHFAPQYEGMNRYEEFYAMMEAVNRSYSDITDAGFTIEAIKLDKNYNLRPVSIEISNKLVDDWFDLRAIVRIGNWEIPFIYFRSNILKGIREYELPDGSIAILPEAWFSKYRNIFEFGSTTEDSLKIHKQHFSLLSDILNEAGFKGYEQLEKLLVPETLPELPVPEGFSATMREYQREGLNWLYWLQSSGLGGCLADDMGLGKTIQTLALLQYNKKNPQPSVKEDDVPHSLFPGPAPKLTSLIIVPASLIYNWENETRKFIPGFKVHIHKGVQRKKSTSHFGNFDVIISSYHTVRQDIEIISGFKFHYIILDESQVIKNPASMLYRSVIQLKSDYKLVLTGTPIENSLTDLWTQLNFVNPGLLGNLTFFRREYAKPIEKEKDDSTETKLKKLIRPFILRRTKEMVARDLPPITEQTVYCDMTEEQEKLYEEEKSSVRNSILKNIEMEGIEKSTIVVLQGLMKLRQISNHPLLAYDEYTADSGKFETVLSDIENVVNEGHKILVFSSFVMHLKLFAGELEKKKIRFSMLTGASTNRAKIVNSFQDDFSNKVFLISLKAGGLGLNLTAADYVFILDPWWNPASEMQALNRAHRIGQSKNVFVYRYISTGTLEEKIATLQKRKSRLAEAFVQSNNPLKDIDIKQLLEIIG
jgi:superfamily II DNA or RNA helicase